MTCSRARTRGFTLVELMVTITVAAILAVIAVPSFTNAIHRNEVTSASNALLADLAYARTEAVTRGTIVTLCPSADGLSCTSPAGTAYESGWMIYTYKPGSAVTNTAYSSTPADGNIKLRFTGKRAGVSIQATNANLISFGPQGEMSPSGTAATAFITCFRTGSSGAGESTAAVPGAQLNVESPGSVVNTPGAVGSTCTAPVPV